MHQKSGCHTTGTSTVWFVQEAKSKGGRNAPDESKRAESMAHDETPSSGTRSAARGIREAAASRGGKRTNIRKAFSNYNNNSNKKWRARISKGNKTLCVWVESEGKVKEMMKEKNMYCIIVRPWLKKARKEDVNSQEKKLGWGGGIKGIGRFSTTSLRSLEGQMWISWNTC